MKKLTLIDNYDSFTYNLLHYFVEEGASVDVVRNDAASVSTILAGKPDGIVISPGPAKPDDAGICIELLREAGGKVPVFGVCLGHQAMGQAFGGKVIRAAQPMHGKTSPILHQGDSVFRDLPSPFLATRYHSLIVERSSLPAELIITAETEDGTIMGLRHRDYPLHGVQFHPESIASEHGHQLIRNFLALL